VLDLGVGLRDFGVKIELVCFMVYGAGKQATRKVRLL
jgi:hypothetical protein